MNSSVTMTDLPSSVAVRSELTNKDDVAPVGDGVVATKNASRASSVDVTSEKQKRVFKIIIIGDSNVGKTCLSFRFCGGKFPSKTEATIGVDFRERAVVAEGEHIKLQLWDTAGQERFRKSMVQHYYRNVHAVVFVFDVTKSSSFESLPHWIDECNRHQLTSDVPRILVGNKCDCRDRAAAVPTNVAQRFADLHNMPLFETSAKDDSESNHVEAIFMTLAHKLKNSRPMMPPPVRGSTTWASWDAIETVPRIKVAGNRGRSRYAADTKMAYEEDTRCFC